jgi:hypothetical protein
MKYLKYFENVYSQYYEESNSREFTDIINSKDREDFLNVERNILEDLLKKSKSNHMKYSFDKVILNKKIDLVIDNEVGGERVGYISSNYLINKFEDEWFLVFKSGKTYKYFKCDQLKGLIELLIDEGIINPNLYEV